MASSNTVSSIGVDEILLTTARGLLQAQRAMDETSLATERHLRETGMGARFGLTANWYTIPEVDLELRVAFNIGSSGEVKTEIVDADYQSRFGFDVQASSELRTKFVAVPPRAGQGLSLLDEAQILRKIGQLKRIVEAWDAAAIPRFVVRYRAFTTQGYSGGLWHVLLTDSSIEGAPEIHAWVAIDDASGEIVRLWTRASEVEGPP